MTWKPIESSAKIWSKDVLRWWSPGPHPPSLTPSFTSTWPPTISSSRGAKSRSSREKLNLNKKFINSPPKVGLCVHRESHPPPRLSFSSFYHGPFSHLVLNFSFVIWPWWETVAKLWNVSGFQGEICCLAGEKKSHRWSGGGGVGGRGEVDEGHNFPSLDINLLVKCITYTSCEIRVLLLNFSQGSEDSKKFLESERNRELP